jgi:signal transduction histidine kinase
MRAILPRHFIFSVLLLLALIGVYIFSEAQRFQRELLRQTEAKGLALADAMEATIRSAIQGNALLEDLISQRLLDNARLIDRLLRFPPVDEPFIQSIAALNGLKKIELLDLQGQPLKINEATPARRLMQEMMSGKPPLHSDEAFQQRRSMMTFMWGRRWRLTQGEDPSPPPKVAERKFWEGSVFGVAVGARSFPGIIAVHANADYILNFRKEIAVQKQIDELGRQSDIEHVVLLDNSGRILAQAGNRAIDGIDKESVAVAAKSNRQPVGRIVEQTNGARHYDVVKPILVNGSNMGVLEIGLSLKPMEAAWHRALRSMIVAGLAILIVGILGMATIFYNQQSHLKKVRALEAEISRRRQLSELGNLAATVAHEIRNPLNSVSMGLQRLKGEFSPTQNHDEYARFLNLMQGEVRRLNAIVEQFLSLARPLHLEREEIAVGDFLRELTTLLAAEASSSKVQIDLQVSPGLPVLRADRNYLKQLLLNLILNGIQAMPQGGPLSIDAVEDKGLLRLTVADRGSGMTAETLARIFEPYFTTKPGGSGLGLSIARRIVEAHGGTIAAESKPGQGSCFRIVLPFRAAEA